MYLVLHQTYNLFVCKIFHCIIDSLNKFHNQTRAFNFIIKLLRINFSYLAVVPKIILLPISRVLIT